MMIMSPPEENIRKKREIQAWVRGEWITTEAYVTDEDLCRYPLCNKKIPSVQSNYEKDKQVPKEYCSRQCWDDHKAGKHLITPLDQFMEDNT